MFFALFPALSCTPLSEQTCPPGTHLEDDGACQVDDGSTESGPPADRDGGCWVEEGPPPDDHALGEEYWAYPVYIAGTERRFADIQGGIWGAEEGDTVVVKPGTYVGTVDLVGKRITLCSEQGPSVTVLDAEGEGPVVRMRAWEPAETVLEGFTLTGGVGEGDDDFGPTPHGGGIYVEWGSPTIRHNVIVGNEAWIGGGIYVRNGAATIENNIIAFNIAHEGGGGLTCTACQGRIAYNSFVHNQAGNGPLAEYFWGTADFVGNLALLEESSDQAAFRWLQPRAGIDWYGGDNLRWPDRDLLDSADESEWPGYDRWIIADPGLEIEPDRLDQHWTLPVGSPAIDCGPVDESDTDGSRADCGAFGGAYGSWPG